MNKQLAGFCQGLGIGLLILALYGSLETPRCKVSASPVPTPTAVISGLADHYDGQRRYHSDTAPYSLLVPWPGGDFTNNAGTQDRFIVSPTRYFVVLSGPDAYHWSTKTWDDYVFGDGLQHGIPVYWGPEFHVAGVTGRAIYYGNENGQFAVLVFEVAGRIWEFDEVSVLQYAARDRALLIKALGTFKLEHATSTS